MVDDPITDALQKLNEDVVQPRLNLSASACDELVKRVGGPRTAQQVLQAKKQLPARRILFLFSSLDSQAVADILENSSGVKAAIDRAKKLKK